MRLYKIDRYTFVAGSEELVDIESVIVPEDALKDFEFQACEYIGHLPPEFELIRKETPENSDPKKGKLVKLKKD